MRTQRNRWGKLCHKYWAPIMLGTIFLLQCLIMLIAGEHVYASTHDNLELHVLDLHLLAENDLFFGSGGVLPKLDGISRDFFFSEWSVYSWLYMLLPTHYAYIVGYLLKNVLGVWFSLLLAKYVLKEKYENYRSILWLAAFAFGSLPLYSAFALYFVSVPLVVYLLLRINDEPHVKWYMALFFYPLLSYFTFFGVFILGYLLVVVIYKTLRDKKVCSRLLVALAVLTAGYITMEYRLFKVMLFSDTQTIRDTMVQEQWTLMQVIANIFTTFIEGIFHAQACQTWFVLPVCLITCVIINCGYFRRKDFATVRREPLNLILLFIFINCVIYGLYGWEPLRSLIEKMVPVLTGFQWNRTIFFNTFLWYVALFIVLTKLWDAGKKRVSIGIALIAIAVVFATPERYNDFYNTCFNHFYEFVKGTESNSLDFAEYYSVDLMEEIKEDIDYAGEKSVAFGLNPAVLEYSNIWTLDGCISYYPQEYKEEFRKLIAPALEKNASSRAYFDDWGARAYIYSASREDIYSMLYRYEIDDKTLYMDMEQFGKMGGTYIFSRIDISNARELGLTLKGEYSHAESPYVIYLYEY